jgi:hypothetical protein
MIFSHLLYIVVRLKELQRLQSSLLKTFNIQSIIFCFRSFPTFDGKQLEKLNFGEAVESVILLGIMTQLQILLINLDIIMPNVPTSDLYRFPLMRTVGLKSKKENKIK